MEGVISEVGLVPFTEAIHRQLVGRSSKYGQETGCWVCVLRLSDCVNLDTLPNSVPL